MSAIVFTEAERELLGEILEEVLGDLRMEIADTDNSFFKQDLRERKAELMALLEKVRAENPVETPVSGGFVRPAAAPRM